MERLQASRGRTAGPPQCTWRSDVPCLIRFGFLRIRHPRSRSRADHERAAGDAALASARSHCNKHCQADKRATMAPPREPKPRRKQRKKSGACGWLLPAGLVVMFGLPAPELMRCGALRHHGLACPTAAYSLQAAPWHPCDSHRAYRLPLTAHSSADLTRSSPTGMDAGAWMACPAFGCPRPIRHWIVSTWPGVVRNIILETDCFHLIWPAATSSSTSS